MSTLQELQQTIKEMVQPGKGILAADESLPTIGKRFKPLGIENNEQNRRAYRSLLFTTPGVEEYLSGVILFEETLTQNDNNGTPLPKILSNKGIVPGVKVDKGTGQLPGGVKGEKITYGLDGLEERLLQYKEQGARFAKWREVYPIAPNIPSHLGRRANAEMLARYAAACQAVGIVPIVEPEVLMDGEHDIDICSAVTEKVLHTVFSALHAHHVLLEYMILKPNMVLPGKECRRAKPEEVAHETIKVFKRTVPAAVPSINFLSGGQEADEATENLNAINELYPKTPWLISFSYGRALQQPALQAWQGKEENIQGAQEALKERARLNGSAQLGQFR